MKYKPKSLKSAIILVVIVVAFILLLSYLGRDARYVHF